MTASSELEIRAPGADAPRTFDARALAALPREAQVADVGALVPGRSGRAVRLSALLGPWSGGFLDVAARDPAFAVSIPLAEAEGAVVVYALPDGSPLPEAQGGPFRLLVPGHADECVHVKAVARLALAATRGRDTRPTDDAAHAALHARRRRG